MPITEESKTLIFEKLKAVMCRYAPPMVAKTGSEKHAFELIGNKPVPYGYDKKIIEGMFFASIARRKDSVAFYFFPSYMNKDLSNVAPNLYKLLKGKTCFHFKSVEQIDEKELHALLKTGVAAWKKAGYMK